MPHPKQKTETAFKGICKVDNCREKVVERGFCWWHNKTKK